MLICGLINLKEEINEEEELKVNKEVKFKSLMSLESKDSEDSFIEETNDIVKDIDFLGMPAFVTFVLGYLIIYALKLFILPEGNKLILLAQINYYIGFVSMEGTTLPLALSSFENIIPEKIIVNSVVLSEVLPAAKFNLFAYIGTYYNGWIGGAVSAFCIFISGLLILFSTLKFMSYINNNENLKKILHGVSVSVKGFQLSAALLLWYYTCYTNTHYNVVFGTLNVLLCVYITNKLDINIIFSLIISCVYSIVLSYIIYY